MLPNIIKEEDGPKRKPYYGKKKFPKMEDKKTTTDESSFSEQQEVQKGKKFEEQGERDSNKVDEV